MTTANTSTEVASHGKFPPFQGENFPSQLVWLALTFALLYLLMAKVALPRIGLGIAERSKRIAEDVAAAQTFKERANAAVAEYETTLAEARTRGQDLVSSARKQHAQAAEAANKRLAAELHERLAGAETSIATSRDAAIGNIGVIAAETAAAIVERLLGKPPPFYAAAATSRDAAKEGQ